MKRALLVLLAAVFVGLATPLAMAEDISKVLIGTWEGEFSTGPRDRNLEYGRTLVIQEVREEHGKWVVENARWGVTGRNLGRVLVVVEVNAGTPTLEFQATPRGERPGARNGTTTCKLALTKEGVLAGTIALGFLPPGNDPVRPLTLKKIG